MRVGIIANTFEKAIGSVAGGHVHFLEIAKRWHDLELVIFAPMLAREVIAAELPFAKFVALPNIDDRIRNRQLRYLARTLMSLGGIRELRTCDVLLATSHFLPDVVPALVAKRGCFVVSIQHVLDPPSVRAGTRLPNIITAIMQSLALRLIAARSAGVLVNDEATADEIGVDRSRTDVTLMSNGIEHVTGDLNLIGKREQSSDTHVVLFLGRLVPTKGIEDLLRAWADVAAALPEARLIIAGTGESSYAATLRAQARFEGVETSVSFVGRVSEDEKRRLLGNATLFAFPSREEGWGIVIAEAMAYGLPCVTYDLPAYRIPFVAGRMSVPIGDVTGFGRIMLEVLKDDQLRTKLGEEARVLSTRFSWASAAATERSALERVLLRNT